MTSWSVQLLCCCVLAIHVVGGRHNPHAIFPKIQMCAPGIVRVACLLLIFMFLALASGLCFDFMNGRMFSCFCAYCSCTAFPSHAPASAAAAAADSNACSTGGLWTCSPGCFPGDRMSLSQGALFMVLMLPLARSAHSGMHGMLFLTMTTCLSRGLRTSLVASPACRCNWHRLLAAFRPHASQIWAVHAILVHDSFAKYVPACAFSLYINSVSFN